MGGRSKMPAAERAKQFMRSSYSSADSQYTVKEAEKIIGALKSSGEKHGVTISGIEYYRICTVKNSNDMCSLISSADYEKITGKKIDLQDDEVLAGGKLKLGSSNTLYGHDIRTPISAIISMTQFAREDIDDREKLLEDIRKIEASNTFLLSLINDILDISKIDSGKIELFPEPYPFSDFIYKVRSMMSTEDLRSRRSFILRNDIGYGR